MNLEKFFKKFSNEEACKIMFKMHRDKAGVVCKKCGCKEHYWQQSIDQYQCKKCRFRTTLRSGTALEASKLPYRYWFYAMYFMTQTKKGISANELQRQLGHKRYEPIWAMMHKIRASMGNREEEYTLDGLVEMDDAFFTASDPNKKDDEQKRGRGSKRQSKVLVMAKVESNPPGRPKKHTKSTKFRFVKMVRVDKIDEGTVTAESNKHLDFNTEVKTDGYRSYSKLKNSVLKHNRKIVPPKEASKVLPWVHTMISNAKRNFLGIYHKMESRYLQNYLDEFCYKVNRRYFGSELFERLLTQLAREPYYKNQLV
jgi:hypothetical protein